MHNENAIAYTVGEACNLFGTSGSKWKSRKSRILHFLKREWSLTDTLLGFYGLLPRCCYVVARTFWMVAGMLLGDYFVFWVVARMLLDRFQGILSCFSASC